MTPEETRFLVSEITKALIIGASIMGGALGFCTNLVLQAHKEHKIKLENHENRIITLETLQKVDAKNVAHAQG